MHKTTLASQLQWQDGHFENYNAHCIEGQAFESKKGVKGYQKNLHLLVTNNYCCHNLTVTTIVEVVVSGMQKYLLGTKKSQDGA